MNTPTAEPAATATAEPSCGPASIEAISETFSAWTPAGEDGRPGQGSYTRQRELFQHELPAWLACPITVSDGPHPDIGRAVVGPLPLLWLGRVALRAPPVRALVATADGRRVRLLSLPRMPMDGPLPWQAIADALHGRSKTVPVSTEQDASMRCALNRKHWELNDASAGVNLWAWADTVARHGSAYSSAFESASSTALLDLWSRLRLCVEWVVSGLDPDLEALLRARSDLSFALAEELMNPLAGRDDGGRSRRRKYILQFVRTAPLPWLRVAGQGARDGSASRLLEVVASGRSVPTFLQTELGVSKSVQRVLASAAAFVPDLPAAPFLEMMKIVPDLPTTCWPRDRLEWKSLGDVLAELSDLVVHCAPRDDTLMSKLIRWVWGAGPNCVGRRLALLRSEAALVGALVFEQQPSTSMAVGRALGVLLSDEHLENLTLRAALLTSSRRGRWRTKAIRTAPCKVNWIETALDRGWRRHEIHHRSSRANQRFALLRSPEQIQRHGTLAGNCLQRAYAPGMYLFEGCILFAVFDGAFAPIATLALKIDCCRFGNTLTFSVHEIRGVNDTEVSEQLLQCSHMLARSLSTHVDVKHPPRLE